MKNLKRKSTSEIQKNLHKKRKLSKDIHPTELIIKTFGKTKHPFFFKYLLIEYLSFSEMFFLFEKNHLSAFCKDGEKIKESRYRDYTAGWKENFHYVHFHDSFISENIETPVAEEILTITKSGSVSIQPRYFVKMDILFPFAAKYFSLYFLREFKKQFLNCLGNDMRLGSQFGNICKEINTYEDVTNIPKEQSTKKYNTTRKISTFFGKVKNKYGTSKRNFFNYVGHNTEVGLEVFNSMLASPKTMKNIKVKRKVFKTYFPNITTPNQLRVFQRKRVSPNFCDDLRTDLGAPFKSASDMTHCSSDCTAYNLKKYAYGMGDTFFYVDPSLEIEVLEQLHLKHPTIVPLLKDISAIKIIADASKSDVVKNHKTLMNIQGLYPKSQSGSVETMFTFISALKKESSLVKAKPAIEKLKVFKTKGFFLIFNFDYFANDIMLDFIIRSCPVTGIDANEMFQLSLEEILIRYNNYKPKLKEKFGGVEADMVGNCRIHILQNDAGLLIYEFNHHPYIENNLQRKIRSYGFDTFTVHRKKAAIQDSDPSADCILLFSPTSLNKDDCLKFILTKKTDMLNWWWGLMNSETVLIDLIGTKPSKENTQKMEEYEGKKKEVIADIRKKYLYLKDLWEFMIFYIKNVIDLSIDEIRNLKNDKVRRKIIDDMSRKLLKFGKKRDFKRRYFFVKVVLMHQQFMLLDRNLNLKKIANEASEKENWVKNKENEQVNYKGSRLIQYKNKKLRFLYKVTVFEQDVIRSMNNRLLKIQNPIRNEEYKKKAYDLRYKRLEKLVVTHPHMVTKEILIIKKRDRKVEEEKKRQKIAQLQQRAVRGTNTRYYYKLLKKLSKKRDETL